MLHRLTVSSKKEVEAAVRKGSGSVAMSSSPKEFSEPSYKVSLKKLFHLCQQSLFFFYFFFDLLSFLHSLLKLKQTFVHRRYGSSRNRYLACFSLKVTISPCYLSWGERPWVVFELSLERYSSKYWDPLYSSVRVSWNCAATWQTPVPFYLLWTHFRVKRLVTCQVPNSH